MAQDKAASSAAKWNFDERRRVIRKKRKEVGLSQTRLGELAGVSLTTISQFESGARDVSEKTMIRLEEALTDAMAGVRMTGMLRAQRVQQTGPLSSLAPPPRGTEAYAQARKQFVQRGTRRMTQLELQNAELLEEIANLREQVRIMKDMIEMLQKQNGNWHEAFTLQDEVIRQQEALIPKKSKEAAAMLRRAKLLKAGAQ